MPDLARAAHHTPSLSPFRTRHEFSPYINMSLYETIGRTVEACGISSLVPSKAEEMGVYTLSIVARPGDHICVRGATHPLWHHGIRGDHDTVYEMSGDSKETAKIRRCSMDSFVSTALAAASIRYDCDSDNWKQASLRVAEEFCCRDDLRTCRPVL